MLFTDPKVRSGFKALVDPLKKQGVESVSIRAEKEKPEIITREERNYFEAPAPETPISVDRSTAVLEIVDISFREGNKWRFAQGGGTFHAEILDEDFMQKVERRDEQFASGDALRVDLEIETVRSGGKLSYTRRIIRVLEHIKGESQGGQLSVF